jgi:hypothetical protein
MTPLDDDVELELIDDGDSDKIIIFKKKIETVTSNNPVVSLIHLLLIPTAFRQHL